MPTWNTKMAEVLSSVSLVIDCIAFEIVIVVSREVMLSSAARLQFLKLN